MLVVLTSTTLERLSLDQLRKLQAFLQLLLDALDQYQLLYIEIGQQDAWRYEQELVREAMAICKKQRREMIEDVKNL